MMRPLFSSLRRVDRHIFLVLAFSIFAWAPLLTPAYFFQAHDAPHSIFYLVEFDQTLRDGYLWPRWAPDFAFGYGYPLFNIYAPLAIYAAEILHLLGLTTVGSVKTMYALATMGAGLAMYLFVRRLFGREAGLLAAVVYMYVPFHLLEIFVRSAYSEFVALALLPLVLWAFTGLVAAPNLRWAVLAGLIYGILALVHHTTFFTLTPLLVLFVLYLLVATWRARGMGRALRTTLYALGSGLLGLALSAIYMLPMLAELRHLKVEQWTAFNYSYGQHFVYFSQLLSPNWGYGYSGPGLSDGMSFQVGAVILVLVVFSGWRMLVGRFPHRGTAIFFLVATVIILWLMSPAAQFAWQALPIASMVQFPWRLLVLVSVTAAVVAGSLTVNQQTSKSANQQAATGRISETGNQVSEKSGSLGHESPSADLLVLLLVIVLGSFAYTLPQYTSVEAWRQQPEAVIRWDRFSPAERVGMVATTVEQPTTGPMEAQYLAGEPLQVATILAGTGTVETLGHGGASEKILVQADGPVTVQFYTYDYPGWRVAIDGQRAAYRSEPPYGLITIDVPEGEHQVSLRMGSTPPRIVGSLISLLALSAIGAGLFGERIWRSLSRLL